MIRLIQLDTTSWDVAGTRAVAVPDAGEPNLVPLFTALIDHVGCPDYVSQLTRALGDLTQLAHLGILAFSGLKRPKLLGTNSLKAPAVAKHTAQLYLNSFYLSDSVDEIRSHYRRNCGRLLAQRQRVEDVPDPAYRSCCYEQAGIIDRISFFEQFGSDDWIAVHLYRDTSQPYFDDADFDRLTAIAPLLTHAADRHRRLSATIFPNPQTTPEKALQDRSTANGEKLSQREFQVCLKILEGQTAKQIARQLGIAPTSVISHRRNAYRKLNIHDHRELFAVALIGHSLDGE